MAGITVSRDGFVAGDATPGRVVFLNGASSSGKSSIARALLAAFDRPWFCLSVDAFGEMRGAGRVALAPGEVDVVLARTRAGFHRAAAGMAAAGNDVVVDHLLSERWRLLDCLRVFEGFDVLFVGVHCDPDELARRESARGDRAAGQGASQVAQVHAHCDYDLVCDTTRASPEECAARIIACLGDRAAGPGAFERLRAAHNA